MNKSYNPGGSGFIRSISFTFILSLLIVNTVDGSFAIAETSLSAEAQISSNSINQDTGKETENPVVSQAGEKTFTMPTSVVIGAREEVTRLPGSGAYLDTEDIRYQSYTDINRVLRKVPGVYIREEDGYGLFPNISLRGVDPARSAKVTLMEDGVLTAPAPYSAPSAYFSPTVARMHGVEVLKGSSQIKYGPHITGGVINYISTPIPEEKTAYIRSIYGSENDFQVHAYVGDKIETPIGDFGILLEGYGRRNDGFKTIDTTPDFRDGDDTGFYRLEPMVKLSWEPNWNVYNRFEVKFGYTELDANETYLGLTEEDFDRDPFRRYAASRFDNIKTDHKRFYFRHYIEPTSNMDITSTVYWSKFRRNWFKLHDVRDASGDRISLSQAIAEGGSHLETLRGNAAGELRVRNNNRSYELYGFDSVMNYEYNFGQVENVLTVGGRYHNDYIRRFQRDEIFTQADNGTISDRDPGTPGDAGNRKQETDAVSFFIQNEFRIGKLSITPGIRYEHLWQKLRNFDNPEANGENELNLVAGGVGANYRLTPEVTLFGGVYRGYSPPSPNAAISDGLEEETSIATELGTRYENPRLALAAEATGFLTYFDDLIVVDNVGGTGTGDSENVGEVRSFGIELSGQFDPGAAYNWPFRNPYFIAFTYTNAELQSDSTSLDPESIFSGGEKGNKVPYIPEFALTIGTGIEFYKFGMDLTGIYVDETFATASNTSQQISPDGTPDARFGKTDDYFVVDVSGYYELQDNIKILGGIQNLFDDEYLVSRLPHGPRPGRPMFAYVGLEMLFK